MFAHISVRGRGPACTTHLWFYKFVACNRHVCLTQASYAKSMEGVVRTVVGDAAALAEAATRHEHALQAHRYVVAWALQGAMC